MFILYIRALLFKPWCALESPGRIVNTNSSGPKLRVPDFIGLGWGQRICIFDQFPDLANASGPGTVVWEPLYLSKEIKEKWH